MSEASVLTAAVQAAQKTLLDEIAKVDAHNKAAGVHANMVATAAALGMVKVNGGGLGVGADGLLGLLFAGDDGLYLKNGKLAFDSSKMDTSVIEALQAKLRVPYWLSGNTTWYVNGAKGSDAVAAGDTTKKGREPDTAFKTPQAALNFISSNFNLGVCTATLEIAGGQTYDTGAGIVLPSYNTSIGRIIVKGDSATNKPRLLGAIASVSSAGAYSLTNLDVIFNDRTSYGSSGWNAIRALRGVAIAMTNVGVDFTSSASAVSRCGCNPAGGSIQLLAGCKFSGQCATVLAALEGGAVSIEADVTIDNTTATTIAYSFSGGVIATNPNANGGINPVILGTANGKRYDARLNGVINVNGGGANFFPGTVAGTTVTGGQYA